jgi:hypothetical protein
MTPEATSLAVSRRCPPENQNLPRFAGSALFAQLLRASQVFSYEHSFNNFDKQIKLLATVNILKVKKQTFVELNN